MFLFPANKESDPLNLVRESRIRMSHTVGNDPCKLVADLRKQEANYTTQIENYQRLQRRVAEDHADYGDSETRH